MSPQFPIQVPELQRNRHFTAREDVLAKLDAVLNPREPFSSFALCGLGGIGKSAISREYFISRAHKFDACLWIAFHPWQDHLQRVSLEKIVTELALRLRSDDSSKEARKRAMMDSVKAWLENPGQSPKGKKLTWLMVFDGVDNPDQLHGLFPDAHDGAVIITSRNPVFAESNWSTTLSIRILYRLGGHPRFLDPIARSTAQELSAIKELVADAESKDPLWTRTRALTSVLENDYHGSLHTSLNLDELSPHAKNILRMVSLQWLADVEEKGFLLGPEDHVEERFESTLLGDPFFDLAPRWDGTVAGEPYRMTPERYGGARDELVAQCLARQKSEQGVLCVPWSVQEVMRLRESQYAREPRWKVPPEGSKSKERSNQISGI
ncbi:hypothetical protein BU26DRAFT_567165 [Trematosphaeria pertusa]|uniref:NB-ARC domain-containing protein n=1 Tax=Trematosphaeria pertusa TaxID=390896 RepID=A0A6A6I8E1_9PLEO|nr:uncharacterized protein BU26DRAFT_567165 [Trematosphaeria pertusa]KAF2246824.1 hypothetical protein BU26DRAFT_567165 [Trematosphaeria pertusa]